MAVLLAVYALFAGVFAITGTAPAALVAPAPAGGPNALPPEVSVLYWGHGFALLTFENEDAVGGLYRQGALIVLPVRKNGCLALR